MSNKWILFTLAILSTMLLTSCGGDDSSSETHGETSSYSMNFYVDARASVQTIELTKLNTDIAEVNKYETWVEVNRNVYTSGSPKITIKVNENTTTVDRSCVVTVTAIDGNKVNLYITQSAATGVGQPEIQDETSDQPAQIRKLLPLAR